MAPKEKLREAFQRQINPWLASEGFRFVKSAFSFERKKGDFDQIISIVLNHRNSEVGMRFTSAFNVQNNQYRRWVKQRRDEFFDGYLTGCMDWNIPGWPTGDALHGFDFTSSVAMKKALADWKLKTGSIGIPFLDAISSWAGAANDLLRNQWQHGRAADFFQIAGQSHNAVSALRAGIRLLVEVGSGIEPGMHPAMVEKKERQDQERLRQIEAFKLRIVEIEAEPNHD